MNNNHLPIGAILGNGKYRIVRFIGAGGFGCTYEAEFIEMHTKVAIKEFFVGSCCNRDATGLVSVGIDSQSLLVNKLESKFQLEARNLFRLSHPNIVRVSDIFRENGTSYYVMEFISGRSLQSIIDHEGPISEARVIKYISQVMDALDYVHSRNILHLDIKPDNIMIDDDTNKAVLIDFGVSKQYDEIDGHNTSTIIGQTPGYAPLEQIGNNIKQFTPATDIYSLGATMYAALTGQNPPASSDIASSVAKLSPLPSTIRSSIRYAIGQMMQPNVNVRPQTISEVRKILEDNNYDNNIHSSATNTRTVTQGLQNGENDYKSQPLSNETNVINSASITKKTPWIALTGAGLILFVTYHCLTNLAALIKPTEYNKMCMSFGENWMAMIASIGLAVFFIVHIIIGVVLTIKNRKSVPLINSSAVDRWSGRNMLVLGIVILAFLVVHLCQFWGKMQLQDIKGTYVSFDGIGQPPGLGTLFIQHAFSSWWTPIVFIVGLVALWFHMTHGFWSMFQTIGVKDVEWFKRLKGIGNIWTTTVIALFVVEVCVLSYYVRDGRFMSDPELQSQYAQFWSERAEELNASLMDDVQKASQSGEIYDQNSYMRACMPVFEKYMPKYEQLTAAVNAQCPDAQNEALQSAKQFSQQMQMMVEQYRNPGNYTPEAPPAEE